MIVERIGHLCDYILFDEAWAGFMKFHPLYAGRFAMGLARPRARSPPGIIATQSTHKQLASFSQASQIHVKDRHIKGQRRRVEHRRFNEMLHAARLDLAVLSAVRLARRRRADDEGPVGRGAVGRHDPARHRVAQEAARGAPRVRGEGAGPGTALVLRAVRARPRRDPGRVARRRRARRRLGGRVDRRARQRSALLGSWRRARPGTASSAWRRALPSPIPTS